MHYNSPILKSANDKDYRGGAIFQDLIQRGTLLPATPTLDTVGFQVFALDAHCYVDRKYDRHKTRALILLNTPYPTVDSQVRLILLDDQNIRKEPQYIEVLPEPDNDLSYRPNQWTHDLKWFLSGRAFSIECYKVMLRYQELNPLKVKSDIFGRAITDAAGVIRYIDQVDVLLNWMHDTSNSYSSQFGYAQRNLKYAPLLKHTARKWAAKHKRNSILWGILDVSQKYFEEDETLTIHAYLFNTLARYVDQSDSDELEPITDPNIYATVFAIHDRLSEPATKTMNQYYPKNPMNLNKLRIYRNQLVATSAIGDTTLHTFLFPF